MTRGEELCPICLEHNALVPSHPGVDQSHYSCPRCGRFRVSGSAVGTLQNTDPSSDESAPRLGQRGSVQRSTASGWIRSNPGQYITYEAIKSIAHLERPGVLTRAECLLVAFDNETQAVGQWLSLREPKWTAHSWSRDQKEALNLAHLIAEFGWLRIRTDREPHDACLTGEGWKQLETLRKSGIHSSQAFVAMSFADEMTDVYFDGLSPGIEAAGYKSHRVDQKEYSDKIDDEIVAQIRRSRFVVADYTDHRPGVYWEAGFAKGLGLEVIPTCRADDIDDLHFDVRQYNTIRWTTCDELREKLQLRIEATLGRGPLRQDPED